MKGHIHIRDWGIIVSISSCNAALLVHLTRFLSMDQKAEKSRIEMAQKLRHSGELQERAAFNGRLCQARYEQEPSVIHCSAG